MDNVMLARSLFGSSMAFHIIFATLGVGIPFMIVIAEIMYQVKKTRTTPCSPNAGRKALPSSWG